MPKPAALLVLASLSAFAAGAPASTGDLPEIQKRGSLRLLVTGGAEYLPRSGDPRSTERSLAEQLARKLGVEAVYVPVADSSELIPELLAGKGDVIVAALAVTPERAEKIAFTRALRLVKQ